MSLITDIFKQELEYIKDKNIRDLVIEALNKVSSGFLVSPASTSGKYHSSHSLGNGGLVRHTKSCVYMAKLITDLEFVRKALNRYEIDYIISASLLHDVCKQGINWESSKTVFEHPRLVWNLNSREEMTKSNIYHWERINFMISTHMGQWNTNKHPDNTNNGRMLPKPKTLSQFIVHLSDLLASRKHIEVDIFTKEEMLGYIIEGVEDYFYSVIVPSRDELNKTE